MKTVSERWLLFHVWPTIQFSHNQAVILRRIIVVKNSWLLAHKFARLWGITSCWCSKCSIKKWCGKSQYRNQRKVNFRVTYVSGNLFCWEYKYLSGVKKETKTLLQHYFKKKFIRSNSSKYKKFQASLK